MITRRSLFLGAASLLAAPSIVRAANLMPVSIEAQLPKVFIMASTDVETDIVRLVALQRWIGHEMNIITSGALILSMELIKNAPTVIDRKEAALRRYMDEQARAQIRAGLKPFNRRTAAA